MLGDSKQTVRSGPILLVLLIVFQSVALLWNAYQCSPVFDEFGHFYAGLAYLQSGNTKIFNVNPPLCRAIGALPAYAIYQDRLAVPDTRLRRSEFSKGRELFIANPSKMQRSVFLGRCLMACFSMFGTYLLYAWGESIQTHGGKIAAALFVAQPQIVGHGSLLTSDVAVSVMMLATTYATYLMVANPTWMKSVVIGLVLGISLSIKFTALIIVPLVVLAYIWRLDKQSLWTMISQSIVTVVLAWILVGLPYGFSGVGQPLRELPLSSLLINRVVCSYLNIIDALPWIFQFLKCNPLPQEYLLGLDRQQWDFEIGLPSFAAGLTSSKGWWWFYLYSMLVKLPTGTLLVCALGLVVFLSEIVGWIRRLWIPLAVLMSVIIFTASKDGFAQQHRYILAAYPFLFLILGVMLANSLSPMVPNQQKFRRWIPLLTYCGLGLSVLACILSAPNWIASFNIFAGGNRFGYKTLFNDASDWGQDTYRIADWLHNNPSEIRTLLLSTTSGHDEIRACGGTDFEDFSRERFETSIRKRVVISKSNLVWLPSNVQDFLNRCGKEYIGSTHIVFLVDSNTAGQLPNHALLITSTIAD